MSEQVDDLLQMDGVRAFDQYGAVIQRMIAQVIGESDHIGEAFETVLSRGKLGADEHHVGKSVFDQHIYDLLVL